jgi:hypothetical protein
LLVSHYLCKLRNRHRDQPPAAARYPGVTGREQATVLIGLIIIALVLMVLAVSGSRQKLLMPNASRRAGRGTARKPGR